MLTMSHEAHWSSHDHHPASCASPQHHPVRSSNNTTISEEMVVRWRLSARLGVKINDIKCAQE